MRKADEHRRFGSFLRTARRNRGFTLKDVADASKTIAPTPDGQISHPHLSQIETGKPIALSLSKILTLASLYLSRPDEIIEQAPEELRRQLLDEWGAWRAARRHEPAPTNYLPQQVARIDAEIDAILAKRETGMRIPFGRERQARRLARWGLINVALPAFLHDDSRAAGFWESGPHTTGWSETPDYTWLWSGIVCNFREWLLYGRRLAGLIFANLATWSIDFDMPGSSMEGSEPLTCAFRDPEHHRLFGMAGIPLVAACAVRWRQTAWQLYYGAPRSAALPEPPDPLCGLLDYIVHVIHPVEATEVLQPGIAPADLVAHLTALFDALGSRRKGAPVHPRETAALAAFFNSATSVEPRARRRAAPA